MKYKTREPRHVPKIYYSIWYFKNTKSIFPRQHDIISQTPILHSHIFDHLTTFDSFSPLNKARYKSEKHCIVTGSIQASQVAMSRRQKNIQISSHPIRESEKNFQGLHPFKTEHAGEVVCAALADINLVTFTSGFVEQLLLNTLPLNQTRQMRHQSFSCQVSKAGAEGSAHSSVSQRGMQGHTCDSIIYTVLGKVFSIFF